MLVTCAFNFYLFFFLFLPLLFLFNIPLLLLQTLVIFLYPSLSLPLCVLWADERFNGKKVDQHTKQRKHKTYTQPCQASLVKLKIPYTPMAFNSQNEGRVVLGHSSAHFFTTGVHFSEKKKKERQTTNKQTNKHHSS